VVCLASTSTVVLTTSTSALGSGASGASFISTGVSVFSTLKGAAKAVLNSALNT
jgi:hypothetical protein